MDGRMGTVPMLRPLVCGMLLAVAASLAGAQHRRPGPSGRDAHGAGEFDSGSLSQHAQHMREDAQLRGVCFVDARRGWAVGDRGVIWHTADGGRTWQLQRSGVRCRLEAVHFIDADHGWAVGGSIQPYTHRTRGMVLRTRDGGRRWNAQPGLMLPLLKQVRFLSPTHGWAIGQPSPMYPGGVFRTVDGARSWSPVHGRAIEDWTCGDFRDMHTGAAGGRRGALSVVMTKGSIRSRTPSLGMRTVNDLRLVGETSGWLVGDGGLVMTTDDGGLTWQVPPKPIPAALYRQLDFKALAVAGRHVWAVGAPGTLVLHSPDAGRTWQAQPTGQTLPLEGIHFVDERHGWAVGAMGTILATGDGGRTWHRQRCGGTRAALLAILADGTHLPLELLAQVSAEEGYLSVAEIVGRRDLDQSASFAAPAAERAHEAALAVGGSIAQAAWQFPLRDKELSLSAQRLVHVWDEAHDGRALHLLEEHLVRKIRQWRPEVIVTHPVSQPAAGNAEAEVVAQVALAAVEKAGDSTSYPEQLTAGRLRPWRVKKVFAQLTGEEAGDVTLTNSQLAMRLGRSLAGVADEARGLLSSEYQPGPPMQGYRLAVSGVSPEVARRDIFSGVVLHPGGEARRTLGDAPPGDIAELRRQAQRRRNMERLIAHGGPASVSDAAWLGEVESLTQGLDRASAARRVYQLGARYAQSGRPNLAAESFHILAERYHDEPITSAALRWLLIHYGSEEAAWCRRSNIDPHVRPAAAIAPVHEQGQPTVVELAGLESFPRGKDITGSGRDEAQPAGESRPKREVAGPRGDANRALALFQLMEKTQPALAAEPALQLAVAAAHRARGEPREAQAIYRRLAGPGDTSPWADCARAELWLAEPRDVCPKPLVRCEATRRKPFLDGRLDDEVWSAAKAVRLGSRHGDDRGWPAVVKLARDEEFLYLAAECRRVPGIEYRPGGDEPRGRDPDLSSEDRLQWLLDVNRDWTSFYRLSVDHRGWVAESCHGDETWNPQWYVAAGGDEQTWTVEAALPLSELGPPAQRLGVWAVGIQRVAAGAGLQSWGQPASVQGRPAGFGLMVLESMPKTRRASDDAQ